MSEQAVNEFNGLIHRPARGLTSGPGPGGFSWMPGNWQSLYSLPRNDQPVGDPDSWEARVCRGGSFGLTLRHHPAIGILYSAQVCKNHKANVS